MKTKYIAAVDFGTSRTGFAWCSSGEITGTSDIFIKKAWPGLLSEYVKTYTELYYDSQHNKWYFGGEARKIRLTGKNFEGNNVRGEHFQEYKMNLYDTGKTYDINKTIDLIAETLKIMKELVFENMRDNFGDTFFSREMFDKETLWVLTVPEGATDDNKACMREAAVKAGLIEKGSEDFERLVFALEPEAGIIACIKDDIAQSLIDNEQVIVVFDAGGGTVDITVKKFCPPKDGTPAKLSSIENVTGACEPSGSKYMDECFFKYLSNLFGNEILGKLLDREEYIDDYQEIVMDWINGKELTSGYNNGESFDFRINIDTLWEILENISSDEYKSLMNEIDKSPERIIIRNNYEYKFSGRKNKYLEFNRKIFETTFHKIFEKAYMPLKRTLEQLKEQNIKCDSLFFIGGFSCNPFLRGFIKKQISKDFEYMDKIRYVEMNSDKTSSAVLFGAVLYAADPGFITDRIAKLTYGVDCFINGEENCFSALISRGDKISFDNEIQQTFHPISPDQTVVAFQFYSTERTDVKKCTDSSLTPLEKVRVNCPDITGGCDREILITLKFGGTETKATILDKTSGNKEQISLHIPFAWNYK